MFRTWRIFRKLSSIYKNSYLAHFSVQARKTKKNLPQEISYVLAKIELSDFNIKNFYVFSKESCLFQEMETPKNCLYFLIFQNKETPKKFLIFQ